MERVVLFGGSGFIGKHLVNQLLGKYEITVITRSKSATSEQFGEDVNVLRLRTRDISKITEHISEAAAVVNLAGENVGEKWNDSKMEKIKKSRLDVASIIIRAVTAAEIKPKVIIQGSAIGIYGLSRGSIDINEETPIGKRGFLTKVSTSNEEIIKHLEKVTRVVYLRTGVVLGNDGGALPKIASQFKLYLGGKIGNGKQWSSWIHIDDEVNAIKFLIENENCSGPFNLTAPNPVNNKEFTKRLAKALNRPHFLTAPSFILRLFLGTMANELLIKGLKVIPARLLEAGFKFKYSNIEDAFNDIYQKDN